MEQNVWKQMYLKLAESVADAVELMPKLPENVPVKNMLIRAMQDAEEIYVRHGEPVEPGGTGETS